VPALTLPHTFVAKTKAKAIEVNANFQAIKTLLDVTKLNSSNIQVGAIITSLLADNSVTAAKIAPDSVGASELIGGIPGIIPTTEHTGLPGSPDDGEVIVWEFSSSYHWLLRYNGGAGLWNFIGGSPVIDQTGTERTISGTSYATNNSPSITVPIDGSYIIEHGGVIRYNAGDDLRFATVSLSGFPLGSKSGITPTNSLEATVFTGSGTAFETHHYALASRVDGVGAGTVVSTVHANASGSHIVGNRWLKVTPIRVG
jgi:hypothetical protein